MIIIIIFTTIIIKTNILYSFSFFKAYIQLNDKIIFQGIVTKFDCVSPRKISQILPVFKHTSSVSTQSHDILANYVASSVQWHKCFGTLRPRGNTKKPKTPDEMIARSQLKDSDYSDDGSDVTFSDRSLRCHKKRTQNKKSIR